MDKAARGNPDRGPFGPRRLCGTSSYQLEEKNRQFTKLYDAEALSFDDIFEEYYEYGQQIKQYVTDTSVILNDALITASACSLKEPKGLCWISTKNLSICNLFKPSRRWGDHRIRCRPKERSTRLSVYVKPTLAVLVMAHSLELFDEVGDRIREVGHEYGTTTGRPRRVGWFDSVVMRHSRRVSGITNLSELDRRSVRLGYSENLCSLRLGWGTHRPLPSMGATQTLQNQSMKNYQAGQKTSQVSATG